MGAFDLFGDNQASGFYCSGVQDLFSVQGIFWGSKLCVHVFLIWIIMSLMFWLAEYSFQFVYLVVEMNLTPIQPVGKGLSQLYDKEKKKKKNQVWFENILTI